MDYLTSNIFKHVHVHSKPAMMYIYYIVFDLWIAKDHAILFNSHYNNEALVTVYIPMNNITLQLKQLDKLAMCYYVFHQDVYKFR